MKPISVARIRFFNAVKCGAEELTYAEDTKFEITLHDSMLVTVRSRRNGAVARTSLFNVPFWNLAEDLVPQQRAPAATPALEVESFGDTDGFGDDEDEDEQDELEDVAADNDAATAKPKIKAGPGRGKKKKS